jgi:hypothetical protein
LRAVFWWVAVRAATRGRFASSRVMLLRHRPCWEAVMSWVISSAVHIGHRRRLGREPCRPHPSEPLHAFASPAGPGARDGSGVVASAALLWNYRPAWSRRVGLLQIVSRSCVAGRAGSAWYLVPVRWRLLTAPPGRSAANPAPEPQIHLHLRYVLSITSCAGAAPRLALMRWRGCLTARAVA